MITTMSTTSMSMLMPPTNPPSQPPLPSNFSALDVQCLMARLVYEDGTFIALQAVRLTLETISLCVLVGYAFCCLFNRLLHVNLRALLTMLAASQVFHTLVDANKTVWNVYNIVSSKNANADHCHYMRHFQGCIWEILGFKVASSWIAFSFLFVGVERVFATLLSKRYETLNHAVLATGVAALPLVIEGILNYKTVYVLLFEAVPVGGHSITCDGAYANAFRDDLLALLVNDMAIIFAGTIITAIVSTMTFIVNRRYRVFDQQESRALARHNLSERFQRIEIGQVTKITAIQAAIFFVSRMINGLASFFLRDLVGQRRYDVIFIEAAELLYPINGILFVITGLVFSSRCRYFIARASCFKRCDSRVAPTTVTDRTGDDYFAYYTKHWA